MLTQFLRTVTFAEASVLSCVVLPEPANGVAIRCYETTGFRRLKTAQILGERTLRVVMRLARSTVVDP